MKVRILLEKAPPDPEIEQWIKKNKKLFTQKYGKLRGKSVLYATAWKIYNSKHKGVKS